MEAEKALN